MDKNTKQMKAVRAKQEEAVLNRILCWIAGGVVLEFLLLLLNRYYCHYLAGEIELRLALGTAVKVIAVAAAVGAVLVGLNWKKKHAAGKSALVSGMFTWFLAGVSVSCFVTWLTEGEGLKLLYVGVPAAVVLVLIYYLYQREFFWVACSTAVSLLGSWLASRGVGGRYAFVVYIYAVLAAVVVLAAAGLIRKAQGAGGMVEYKGEKRRVFPKDANYSLLYLTAVITVAVLAAGALGVGAMILYGASAAWVLVMAVYYTVKLM